MKNEPKHCIQLLRSNLNNHQNQTNLKTHESQTSAIIIPIRTVATTQQLTKRVNHKNHQTQSRKLEFHGLVYQEIKSKHAPIVQKKKIF